MKPRMALSARLERLPPYLFAELDRRKKAAIEAGADVISLGVGDPDQPTPAHIVEAAQRALENPAHHKYPFGSGMQTFREAVVRFMKGRYDLDFDPRSEVHALIGSKEGIGHLPLALINPGDVVLVPDPGYPVYQGSTILADGEVFHMPLREENGFLPDLDGIPPHVLERARLMFLGYPNNPTAASVTPRFFEDVVAFAKEHGLIVAHDSAYAEIYFGTPPLSFLQTPGARDVGVEFHSLSKTYNMTGWRAGWVCGNAHVIKQLATVKDNYDSGVFEVVQEAATAALSGPQACVAESRRLFQSRRDLFVPALRKLGWTVNNPEATFYVWAHTPRGFGAMDTVAFMLEKAAVLATPGNGFGPSGEGFVRFALTVDEARLEEAITRLSRLHW